MSDGERPRSDGCDTAKLGGEHADNDAEEPICSSCSWVTARLALTTALGYSLAYFWRYPIFLLPEEVLRTHVATVGARRIDLQAAFSLAFILGFGVAKVPAMRFMASDFYCLPCNII